MTHEEKEVADYDRRVFLPHFELDEDHFEQHLGPVNEACTDGRRWANVAYKSRHSELVIFVLCHKCVHDMVTIGITNDPIRKEDNQVFFPSQ